MAHNRQPEFKPNNHHPSSSEEEEEEEDVEEEEEEASGSEEEDEQTSCSESEEQEPKNALIPPPQSAKKQSQPQPQPPPPDLSSSGTEDSDSDDTDSDSPPKKSSIDPNIKPISSKPMEREEGPNPAKKSGSGSGSKPSSTPSPAKAGKRPPPAPAVTVEKDSKKAKKSTGSAADEDSKKQLFQRLWSEDDEIVILKGMIDYKNEKNGENPVADMGAFHEFIKKALHVDVSRAQLVDKVRRLKKKYVNNASREKNGKDRSFSKSHEQKGYELSKLIWGSSSHTGGTESKKNQNQNHNNNSNPAKGNAAGTSSGAAFLKANGVEMEKDVSAMEVDKSMDVSRFVQYGRNSDSPILQEEIVKAGLELVEASKREELEEKWKKLKKQELQLYVMRLELLKEQSALVYEAVNSLGN